MVLYPAVSLVSINPEGSDNHSARDAHALAQGRLSALLALEIASPGRAATSRDGAACADPTDEYREPTWGAPRIHGELLKLGFEVAQSSVAKYMVKRRGPPSQEWRTFLRNHAPDVAAMDLFVVPTIGFDLLYAFVIVRLGRRDIVWINVSANPTAEWVARQITEAFPWNEAPRYMIRDRDRIYGAVVTRRLRAVGIRDRPIAPASPWQNGFAERLIGSIRRECVDHIIVLSEAHLRGILKSYARYYNETRTHLALDKDAPVSRPVERTGVVRSRAILGGLHHHYARA
jgi:transposase InsO family protein